MLQPSLESLFAKVEAHFLLLLENFSFPCHFFTFTTSLQQGDKKTFDPLMEKTNGISE